MNTAVFPSTTLLGDIPAEHGGELPTTAVRTLQIAAALLALTALVLGVLAALTPPLAQAEGAFLAALGSLAALRGAGVVQRRALAAKGWLDASTGLANGAAVAALGEAVLARARRARRPLTVLVLDFADLTEVREIYGREIGNHVLQRVAARMQALAGPYGLALRTGKAQFTVLMPGATTERAQARVERVLGKPTRIEYDAGDSEIVLVPDIAAEMSAPAVETVRELYHELSMLLARQRKYEQRRQQWLQRERERHSRPMSLV